jgi:hypothetical protein
LPLITVATPALGQARARLASSKTRQAKTNERFRLKVVLVTGWAAL